MADDTNEIVGSVGRELVSHLAPEELPLYPAPLSQFQDAKGGRGRKGSSDDQLLGVGAAEAVTMLTPVILSFTPILESPDRAGSAGIGAWRGGVR